jgi:ligand-binding sensor domain-containing protein
VTDIAFDKDDDELWLVGWKCGLKKFNKKTFNWITYELTRNNEFGQIFKNDTYSLLHDSNNNLWIGTWGEGIYTFDKEKLVFTEMIIDPNYQSVISGNYDIILDIYEDPDKNIWIGLSGGGAVILNRGKTIKGISIDNNKDCGLESFNIGSIHETDDGYLWVGTNGGGLYRSPDKQNFELIPNQ